MKIGAENKKQLIAMMVLLVIAAGVVIYDFAGGGSSSAASPASATAPASSTARNKSGTIQVQNDLDPTLRLDVLEASRKVRYEAGGRNIFKMEEPPPPVAIANVRATPTPIPTPTPTPPPPPIPLKFYGFANKPNEPRRVFLVEGEPPAQVTFIAKQGEIVDRRYRVSQIQNTSVLIEDVLTNNKQSIPLTAR